MATVAFLPGLSGSLNVSYSLFGQAIDDSLRLKDATINVLVYDGNLQNAPGEPLDTMPISNLDVSKEDNALFLEFNVNSLDAALEFFIVSDLIIEGGLILEGVSLEVGPAPVAVPAALPLLGSALIGLVGLNRRRRT